MRKFSMILMVAALGFVTAACGGGTTAGTAAKPAEPAAATASSGSSGSAKESTVEQIKKRGKLIIATSGNFRPITFMNEQGQIAGLDIEIGNAIADKLGVKAEFVPGNLAGLIPGMNAGKFDLVMSGLTMTDDRKKAIDFSDKYLSDGAVAVVKKDNTTVKDVQHLQGLVAGVIGGSGTHSIIKELGGYKELKEYPGHAEALTDLKAGRIEVYTAGNIAAMDYIKNDKSEIPLKIVGEQYAIKDIGVGIRKNEDELKSIINSVIAEKKKDGSLDKLIAKWIGTPAK
ncbi:substrate-binding periplasmic protein [Paenibacillus rigui]|nr:transporter substrate-binding domain-containing protein [Paenibacillus rigui]